MEHMLWSSVMITIRLFYAETIDCNHKIALVCYEVLCKIVQGVLNTKLPQYLRPSLLKHGLF